MTLEDLIAAITGSTIASARRLGGDLGGALLVSLAGGEQVVAKQGARVGQEGAMLRAMAATGAPAPQVLHCEDELLVMAYVPAGEYANWASLAEALDSLHQPACELYGWKADYAFGPVTISNSRSNNWPQFWAENRLLCHGEKVDGSITRRLESLAKVIGERLPASPPPALLHGDLWGGNILYDASGLAALIDPACYYGHREVDIAMLTLFDHPPEEFFTACHLEPGWQDRLPIYRLWPLLVHLRLFGNAYRGAVKSALDECGF